MPVYFVQAGDDGPIKIGVASNVARRVRGMRVSNAAALKICATTPGERDDERALHQRFSHCHLQGEWFAPDQGLLRFIATLPAWDTETRRPGRPPYPGEGALAEWMTAEGLGDEALALRASVNRATISRIRRRKMRPSIDLAKVLIAISGDKITFEGLFGSADLPALPESGDGIERAAA
jgi:DNA-binding XRE family transcriptional regulator